MIVLMLMKSPAQTSTQMRIAKDKHCSSQRHLLLRSTSLASRKVWISPRLPKSSEGMSMCRSYACSRCLAWLPALPSPVLVVIQITFDDIVNLNMAICRQGCGIWCAPGSRQRPLAFLVVLQVEFDEDVKTGHSSANKVASEGVAPRSRQARIGKELAGLAASLPLTPSSSVFVRVDQTHMTLWKALITGWAYFLHIGCMQRLGKVCKTKQREDLWTTGLFQVPISAFTLHLHACCASDFESVELYDIGLHFYLEALVSMSKDVDL